MRRLVGLLSYLKTITMRINLAIIFALSLFLVFTGCKEKAVPPGGAPSSGRSLALPPEATLDLARITLRPQIESQWCWAASTQMILEYYGEQTEQCKLANEQGITNAECCPKNPSCDKARWPDILFKKHNLQYSSPYKGALPLPELQRQIAIEKSPIAFSWTWKQGNAHMMVAVGYKPVEGDTWIDVFNPLPENVGNHDFISYAEYVEGDDHVHSLDYYGFKKKRNILWHLFLS